MKPNSPPSIPFLKMVEALAFTIAIAGVVHVFIVGVTAIVRRDLGYINPIDFLGFSIMWPQLRDSTTANFLAWLVLLAIFIAILAVGINKHLYVSIIQERKKQLSQRLPNRKKS